MTDFEDHPTADEVLDGVDLTGRTALVTGSYSGIGPATVAALSRAGARVLAPARRPDEARSVLADVERSRSARWTCPTRRAWRRTPRPCWTTARTSTSSSTAPASWPPRRPGRREGWELQFATNHLGHYALVNRLWPLLDGGARVVSVSSGGHHLGDIRWDDPWFTLGYDKWEAYGQSKTANALFAVHLDAVGNEHGVRAFSLHPGAILTPLGRHLQAEDLDKVMVYDENGELVLPPFKTPEQGAATSVWAATAAAELEAHGGAYLEDVAVAPPACRVSDALGYLMFNRGAELGEVAITSAAASSYPLIPILVGLIAYRERVAWYQLVGVGGVLVGMVVLSLG